MANNEMRKTFKNYDLIITRGKVATVLVVVAVLVLFFILMLYLGDAI